MSEKPGAVVALVPHKRAVNEKLVENLKAYLAKAESGEMQHIVLLATITDGATWSLFNIGPDCDLSGERILGELALLRRKVEDYVLANERIMYRQDT